MSEKSSTPKRRYFLVQQSLIYKGTAHPVKSLITEVDDPKDKQFQDLLRLVSDSEDVNDEDSFLVELEEVQVRKSRFNGYWIENNTDGKEMRRVKSLVENVPSKK